MIPLAEFEQALHHVRSQIDPTPLVYSEWLSETVQGEVYLKLQNLNPGRSFKIRGATHTLLSQPQLPAQVITASGGNHGLGVAIACRQMKIPCKVVLPLSTSNYRVTLLQRLGAAVELVGEAWDEANDYALGLATASDCLYIHPFADQSVIVGQGTISLELREQLGERFDEIDNLVASVGGGGLLAGNALALESMGKPVNIIAVETKGADSLAQSLAAGQLVKLDAITSIAKTLGAKETTPFIFETMQRLVKRMEVIEDKQAVETIFQLLEYEKILVEPATSCSVAALLNHPNWFRDKLTVVIVCGSNVSYSEVLEWQNQFSP